MDGHNISMYSDLKLELLSHCLPTDVLKMCQLNQEWASFSRDEIVWSQLLKQHYPSAKPLSTTNKRELYIFLTNRNEQTQTEIFKEFKTAIKQNNAKKVEMMIEGGIVDPSARSNKAIIKAATCGHVEVVKLLLADPRVDPSDQNNEAIIEASESGYVKVVKLLLADPRVDPSDRNNQAIIWASEYGNVEVVELLLKDPRVNPSDQNNKANRS